jgi:class 3 adenylate cyclase
MSETRKIVAILAADVVGSSRLAGENQAGPAQEVCEAKCLSVFDAVRRSILEVAREAYSRGRRNYYTLTAADFP